jgi:hypothetical protein
VSKLAERLKNPFTDATRKVRNHLLIVGLIGILVADVGLMPSEISALGIKFTGIEQANLLKLLFSITIYYVVTFFVFSISELSASKLSESKESIDSMSDQMGTNLIINVLDPSIGEKHNFQEFKSGSLSFVRSVYEVLVPLIWGCYCMYALYNAI